MIYDSFASFYDRFMAPLESMFLKRWRAETTALLPAGSRILELGSGTGLNFAHYPECAHAVASEISMEMILHSKSRGDSLDLIAADVQKLPFPDDYFDSAFATLVFCSVPEPKEALEEIRRVVKPNGNLVLLEHVRPKGLLGYVFDVLNVATVALIDDYFNRETASIVAEAGLDILEVRSKAFGVVNLIVCENPT